MQNEIKLDVFSSMLNSGGGRKIKVFFIDSNSLHHTSSSYLDYFSARNRAQPQKQDFRTEQMFPSLDEGNTIQ